MVRHKLVMVRIRLMVKMSGNQCKALIRIAVQKCMYEWGLADYWIQYSAFFFVTKYFAESGFKCANLNLESNN